MTFGQFFRHHAASPVLALFLVVTSALLCSACQCEIAAEHARFVQAALQPLGSAVAVLVAALDMLCWVVLLWWACALFLLAIFKVLRWDPLAPSRVRRRRPDRGHSVVTCAVLKHGIRIYEVRSLALPKGTVVKPKHLIEAMNAALAEDGRAYVVCAEVDEHGDTMSILSMVPGDAPPETAEATSARLRDMMMQGT
jgi:hypothetical protein